ncbi:nucleotide exchange factor GrpE [Candidatus Fermentibacterales bacterium]|nr:nucleotide exchange factor GrpE [Candidatus Fermentibacterales bacterium]
MAATDPRRGRTGDRRKRKTSGRAVDEAADAAADGGNGSLTEETGVFEERIGQALSEARENAERAEEFKQDLLRLQAEFDNYRKRQAREFRRLCGAGKRDLVTELLPVIDNFDRAARLREEGHGSEEILAGLFQTLGQMLAILRKEGVEEILTEPGDSFDPNVHEAMIAETVEDASSDVVLEVLQKGYSMENELLRPTRVRVGRPPDSSGAQEEVAREAPEGVEPPPGETFSGREE